MKKLYYLMLLALTAMAFTACSDDDDVKGYVTGGSNENKNIVTDDPAVARLEFPRLKGGNNVVIVYRTNNKLYDADRVNYAVEWDCDKKAQRWSCYQMHKGYNNGNYDRVTNGAI